jgi:trigger factor
MQTNIRQLSPVEFELEILADRDTLENRIVGQLKKLRPHVSKPGFRPGRVPMGMVRKLHGNAVAYDVVDELIQEVYREQVLESEAHDVLGSPTVTELDYEPYGDLRALVQFGVRPSFELADLSEAKVERLAHDVTEEEIEQELNRLQTQHATYDTVDEPAGGDDYVRVDLQELDLETDTPVIGSRREGIVFHLGAKELDRRVAEALTGSAKGDTVRFSISHAGREHGSGDDEHHHDHDHGGHTHDHLYEASVVEVQRQLLPELTDELAASATQGRIETIEELRSDVEQQLRNQWERALREKLEDDIVRLAVELHDFEIPPGIVDVYLDSQIKEIAQRNDGKLPDGFDVEYFRQQNRDDAERMARWMLIREQIVREAEIAVDSSDLDESFAGMGGGDTDGQSMRQLFEKNYPEMIDQMERRIESKKVFDWLLDRLQVEDKPWVDDRVGS